MNVTKELKARLEPSVIAAMGLQLINSLAKSRGLVIAKRSSMLPWFAVGAAVGAAAWYFLDPKKGADRRLAIAEKSKSLANDAVEYGQKFIGEAKNAEQETAARATNVKH